MDSCVGCVLNKGVVLVSGIGKIEMFLVFCLYSYV